LGKKDSLDTGAFLGVFQDLRVARFGEFIKRRTSRVLKNLD